MQAIRGRLASLVRLSCLGLSLATLGGTAAQAADCKPLQYITGLPLTISGNVPFVPITLNGNERFMMIDTGGVVSQVTRETVAALKLPPIGARVRLYDVNGNVSEGAVKIAEFALGPMKARDANFDIAAGLADADLSLAGLIANDILMPHDADFDFASGRLNFFSRDHCAGQVYWPNTAVAVIPMTLDDFHIHVPVMLDGHELHGIIDTGASRSLVQMEAAVRLFGFVPDKDKVVGHANNDPLLPMYGRTFSSLAFGGLTINNPRLAVMSSQFGAKDANNNFSTGSRITRKLDSLTAPEIVIGMDVLRKLHLYMAFGERKMYVTPANTADAAALPPVYSATAAKPQQP